MRNVLFALLLTVAGAFGLAAIPSSAQAYGDARIYVDFGDVSFAYGRPYYRHDRSPLYVSYDRYRQPRYYRHAPRRAYRPGYYDPYYDNRVIVRPRVVVRDYDYRYGYRDRNYRHDYYRDDYRSGYRDRYWVDRYGRRHYYRH